MATRGDMQPSTKLGHYEILFAIGKGGMGEVWEAKDTKLGREVAIKTLALQLGLNVKRTNCAVPQSDLETSSWKRPRNPQLKYIPHAS
jgi:serine/threonine protein kinase